MESIHTDLMRAILKTYTSSLNYLKMVKGRKRKGEGRYIRTRVLFTQSIRCFYSGTKSNGCVRTNPISSNTKIAIIKLDDTIGDN